MTDPASPDTQQVLVFRIGGQRHALPIESVREVVGRVEPQPVATATAALLGLHALRGQVIAVYDLAGHLGVRPSRDQGALAMLIVVELDDEVAGLAVDDVDGVMTIDGSQLQDAPFGSSSSIKAVAHTEFGLVVLLDPGMLVGTMCELPDTAADPVAWSEGGP